MKPSIPNQRSPKSRAHSGAGGFSLVELLFSLVLLGIVLGVAMEAIIQLQQRNFAETAKVDTVQETRDFVDQMVRDIHDVGYPPGAVKKDNPDCTDKADVACGLIYFTSTEVRYEGDLDGTGTVYRIWVKLEIPPSGKCPCKLERGAITK
ncbi:MAG TPA: type II secretion system protein, partial [Nitrospira sp.]